MNKHPSNDEFEDEKLNRLYKKGSKETPSSYLNQRILAASVQHTSKKKTHFWNTEAILTVLSSSRSLATAFVIILSLSIVLTLQFEQADTALTPAPDDMLAIIESASKSSAKQKPLTQENIFQLEHQHKSEKRIHSPAPAEKRDFARKLEAEMPETAVTSRITQADQSQAVISPAMTGSVNAPELAEQQDDYIPAISAASSVKESGCAALSQRACLHSDSCTLVKEHNQLSCQVSIEACELKFKQITDRADVCDNRPGCTYQEGHCLCDENGLCQCQDNVIPACLKDKKLKAWPE